MKERTKLIVEGVGATSVVFSLLIVAYQIQQSNLIARVTTEYEIANNYSEWNESLYADVETTKNLARVIADPTEIIERDLEDQLAIYSFVGRSIYIWHAAEMAYKNGMLSEQSYEMALQDIPITLNIGPGVHTAYRAFLNGHSAISNSEVAKRIYEIIGN